METFKRMNEKLVTDCAAILLGTLLTLGVIFTLKVWIELADDKVRSESHHEGEPVNIAGGP
jgi:hypothetical protein